MHTAATNAVTLKPAGSADVPNAANGILLKKLQSIKIIPQPKGALQKKFVKEAHSVPLDAIEANDAVRLSTGIANLTGYWAEVP